MVASQPILVAILRTVSLGLVYVRKYSSEPDVNLTCVNEIAEALHDVPQMACRFDLHEGSEAELLVRIRAHLSCFNHQRWPGSPNLLEVFEDELSGA
jgi:hypothetical protein